MDNIYTTSPVEILKIRKHNSTECSFLLNTKLKALPGQFVIVSLPNAGEVPISISSLTLNSIELTIRNVGMVTSKIFKRKQGELLYIRGPYGNSFPLEKFYAQHLLVIVGGSAIAPIKPLVESYLNNELSLKRLDILAGFKSPRHILFRKELGFWKKRCNLILTVDNDEDYAWMGSIGFVVQFIKNVPDIGSQTKVILIGPQMMMINSVRELLRYNVQEEGSSRNLVGNR